MKPQDFGSSANSHSHNAAQVSQVKGTRYSAFNQRPSVNTAVTQRFCASSIQSLNKCTVTGPFYILIDDVICCTQYKTKLSLNKIILSVFL